MFRDEWLGLPVPLLWHVGRAEPNLMRGVYVDEADWTYFCVISGRMTVGLHDLRPETPIGTKSAMLLLSSERLQVLAVAPGVSCSFHAPVQSAYVIGSSADSGSAGRHCLRWEDPELEINWPCSAPDLSRAERAAPTLPPMSAAAQNVVMTDSRATSQGTRALPCGVSLRPLSSTHDHFRGATEIYRSDWKLDCVPVQWNLVSSRSNTLRGVHVHLTHWDYLCIISGEMLLALHDMRPESPTYRLAVQQPLPSEPACSIAIPPGVAHGFYFASETTYFYAVSHYWNPQDELGCSWNDPALGLSWPTTDPLLSPRDANAPAYGELARELAEAIDRGTLRS